MIGLKLRSLIDDAIVRANIREPQLTPAEIRLRHFSGSKLTFYIPRSTTRIAVSSDNNEYVMPSTLIADSSGLFPYVIPSINPYRVIFHDNKDAMMFEAEIYDEALQTRLNNGN